MPDKEIVYVSHNLESGLDYDAVQGVIADFGGSGFEPFAPYIDEREYVAEDIREFFEDGSFNVLGIFGTTLTNQMKDEITWAKANFIPVRCYSPKLEPELQAYLNIIDMPYTMIN